MRLTKAQIQELLEKVRTSIATSEDCETLLNALRKEEDNETLREVMAYYDRQQLPFGDATNPKWRNVVMRILSIDKSQSTQISNRRRFIWSELKRTQKIAAIGILMIVLGALSSLLITLNRNNTATALNSASFAAPSSNKATITLANGQQINLDTMQQGYITLSNGIIIKKLQDGKLVYETGKSNLDLAQVQNTLSNHKGSKPVSVTLSDGSQVWLNAASSLRYPVAFPAQGHRNVQLDGEAYFEVAKDTKRHFIVTTEQSVTEVLGTHFNINAFKTNTGTAITLAEGSVKVKKTNSPESITLKPSQQAQVTSGIKVQTVNVDEVLAWRHGYFNFDGMALKDAIPELERWYNIDINSSPAAQEVAVFGKIDRSLSLSELLHVLAAAGFRYELDKNKQSVTIK